jgi:hypothetical protein
MIFDTSTNYYYCNIPLKQGFYNYTYVTKSSENLISNTDIRGDFSETENLYTVIVYHKAFGSLFDRVIGVGSIQYNGER